MKLEREEVTRPAVIIERASRADAELNAKVTKGSKHMKILDRVSFFVAFDPLRELRG